MKYFLFILITVIPSENFCQNISPFISQDEIIRKQIKDAKIQKSIKYYFSYEKGKIVEPGIVHEVKLYDKEGRTIERINYTDSILRDRQTYKYDSLGNEFESIYFDADSNIDIRTTNDYDNGSKLIRTTYLDWQHDWIGYKIIYEYDSIGNLVSKTNYDRKKDTFLFDNRTTYFYNGSGHKIKWERYENNNLLVNWSEYKYNSEGNLLSEIMYWTDEGIGYEHYLSYDSAGYTEIYKFYKNKMQVKNIKSRFTYDRRLLEETNYDSNDKVVTIGKQKYDNKGRETEWVLYDKKMKIIRYSKTFYNDYDNSSEWILYNPKHKIISKYSYLYDLHGNKLEDVSYANDLSPSRLIKFVYEYY